ncbi:signal transduction histidine kinase [Solidesulfovibrio carbinoliphilus subsp. oakridgensis]|uniref:Signal transduction histidine kinase n=1 Tax=Solidesulfovibrio carbinoliphilus subsp. oakridgensis TaxID=694327 RepID=G7Q6X4_9BACT|nr:histidine kinase dimerization/phosphoacceptor domain -containing protein [Solidesulfovibrio carbinoliphilus]EHJ48457.1 signal transduction histidine kinase [Solidesulfovibrio carbinoliphilus subsp. oakridgensis]
MRIPRFAPWQWFLERSIETLLLCVVLLAALPAMAIITLSSFEARDQAERQAEEELRYLTRSLAAIQHGVTRQAEGLLAALARTEAVGSGDLAACDRLFTALLRDHPELSNIFMADASGRVTAAGLPPFVGEDLSDRKYFREAMDTGKLGVGDFILGRTTGRPILAFALPTGNAGRPLQGILGMSYYLQGYEAFLEKLEMPPHARVTLLDRNGRRMLAYPLDARYPLGAKAHAPNWERFATADADEGTFMAPRLTGEEGLFSFARLRLAPEAPPYMTIVVSSARREAFRNADILLRRGLALVLVATFLALLIARLAGRAAIGRGITNLADAAGRLAAGDLSARVPDDAGSLEVRRLGRIFNAMAAAHETRDRELIEAAVALGKMRGMLNNILESMPSAIIGCDSAGRVTHINRNAERLLGLERDTAMGRTMAESMPALSTYRQTLEQSLRERRALVVEKLALPLDQAIRLMDMLFYPLIANGAEGVVIRLDDVTEREKAREALERNLEEKNILLKEIHHRVKNNLQIILSFISLQAEDATDSGERDRFRQLEIRIRSMALVHQQLYSHGEVATIDMGEYVATLARGIVGIFRKTLADVALVLDTEPLRLSLDKAVPCGLLLGELITNACKHAFVAGRAGELRVGSRVEGGVVRLWVEDTGPGTPEGFDYARAQTMGMTLIKELVRQLQGRAALSGDGGLRVEVVFPA